jgi:hypothetical protein
MRAFSSPYRPERLCDAKNSVGGKADHSPPLLPRVRRSGDKPALSHDSGVKRCSNLFHVSFRIASDTAFAAWLYSPVRILTSHSRPFFSSTDKPRITNNSVYEQIFRTQSVSDYCVSSYEHASRQHRGAISWEYQRRQYS